MNLSHTISKSILNGLLLVVTLVWLTGTAIAQPAPSLQWELVNPFRFIHDQNTVDELRTIYAGLSDHSASALERKLQDLADTEVDEIRRQARTKFDCNHTNSEEEKRQCFAPYSGWFARLAANNHGKTCWDSAAHEYRRVEPCKDYIYPQSHRVRVWVENPESLGDALPHWTVNPAPTPSPTPCDAKPDKRFCVEFNIPYQSENPVEVRVSAQFPNLTLATNPNIKVKDLLIVGLGDSYAAGEGNPDVPAEFINEERDPDPLAAKLTGVDKTKYPKKDKGNEAVWLDKRCHRSMYSYQFKTALLMALDNPREAITFVSFSCSGAVTPQIIKDHQPAKERGFNLLLRLDPQLDALRDALRNGTKPLRPIDYLLLSTGGNDIGFAKYVAYILLPRSKLASVAIGVNDTTIQRDFDRKKIEKTLWGDDHHRSNYKELQRALFEPPNSDKPKIRITGCETGNRCDRIVLTPYPNVFTAEDGRMCEGNRLEFDDAFGLNPLRKEKIQLVFDKVFTEITKAQSVDRIKSELGWTVVDDNVNAYVKHGFCARDATNPSIGEKFQIPTWVNDWTIFPPRDYRSYYSRKRWLRLPVDSKLTADQEHNLPFGLSLDLFFEDVTSSVMHPTAEGLATTADLNVGAIKKIGTLASEQ